MPKSGESFPCLSEHALREHCLSSGTWARARFKISSQGEEYPGCSDISHVLTELKLRLWAEDLFSTLPLVRTAEKKPA